MSAGSSINGCRIRDADVVADRAELERVAAALTDYERAFEPDRGIGRESAAAQVDDMIRVARDKNGRIFVAETPDGTIIGWAVCQITENSVFVRAEERTYGYVNELYVDERARGTGAGHALMQACEAHFIANGVKISMLAALWDNAHAREFYARSGYQPYAVDLRKYL